MTAVLEAPPTVITYAWDGLRYSDFVTEADALIRAHWDEVGSHRELLTLRPDHTRYLLAEQHGQFHLVTARAGGRLVGYMGVMTMRHPRDRFATIATDEFIYVAPDHRAFRVGPHLLAEALRALEAQGVAIVYFREKTRRKGGGYLERFGFAPLETVYSKVLRAPEKKDPR